ncbi:MAG: DUF6624 domain-containing protein [Acidobacteriota bacterium]
MTPRLFAALFWLMTLSTDPSDLNRQARNAFRREEFSAAGELFAAAVAAGASRPEDAYNAACAFARTGDRDAAFRFLDLAVARGYANAEHLLKDSDLSSLTADPRWAPAVEAVRRREEERLAALGDRVLHDELLRMTADDQAARAALGDVPTLEQAERVAEVDGRNLARFRDIVAQRGWPGRALVGADGAQAAFLLAQHADSDPVFQRLCLTRLGEALARGDAAPSQLAYLTDRVRMAAGEPQVYGTQFREVAGRLEPFPIEDAEHVDRRRAEVGLGPLAEYAERLTGGAPKERKEKDER